jgi:hypothetical protein
LAFALVVQLPVAQVLPVAQEPVVQEPALQFVPEAQAPDTQLTFLPQLPLDEQLLASAVEAPTTAARASRIITFFMSLLFSITLVFMI